MMDFETARHLIVLANKLGAKGQQVVGLVRRDATSQYSYELVTHTPDDCDATETPWYDK